MQNSIIFVTHNQGKVISAQKYFEKKGTKLEIYQHELYEPRLDDIEQIAKAKVIQAYNLVKSPCFALDTGFYIDELNGFPKSFVNFALETITIDGILKLMEGKQNRKCCFKECLAYMENNNPDEIKYFYSTIPGTLASVKKGKDTVKKWSELWYIFQPENYSMTLAEMSDEERELRNCQNRLKGKFSAIEQFANSI